MGEFLKYVVYAGGGRSLARAWSSALRHLGSRDRFNGWAPKARQLETFVDPQRFRGTCYRAANWIPLGVTTAPLRIIRLP